MIQQTSLESYLQIQAKISERHNQILSAFKELGEATDFEVAKFLYHSDPNYCRPRRNELVKLGLLEARGKRNDKITGKMAITWGLVRCAKASGT